MDKQKKSMLLTLAVLAVIGTAWHFTWSGKGEETEAQPVVDTLADMSGRDVMSLLEIPYRL